MYDIIYKKKLGGELTADEIGFAVNGFVRGEVPDYQMSALLMAICLKGMTKAETAALTDCMARSGDMADLSEIPGIKADKHSTGGVGDKTTLIVAPIVAACGVSIAKMSGRGLGHTGGTIDKLESIPGFRTDLDRDKFIDVVRKNGLCVIGQSGNITPADKKIYALRDVTATVDCISLIASSIMSKKIAAGADCIILDVKTGSGAFMKTPEEAAELAHEMVEIGKRAGKRCAALVTDMSVPLGRAVGNSLEVAEAVQVLRQGGPDDLRILSLRLASELLALAGNGSRVECADMAREALDSGAAFHKFRAMVKAQGGDVSVIENTDRFPKAQVIRTLEAGCDGYILDMDTAAIGETSVMLGAGRETKESVIDPSAGVLIFKKTGDRVKKGEAIAELRTAEEPRADAAEKRYLSALSFGNVPPVPRKLIYSRIDCNGTERL